MKDGGRAEDEGGKRAGMKKLKWKSEEDEWGDGSKKDKSVKSAGENAEEGEEKALTAVGSLPALVFI